MNPLDLFRKYVNSTITREELHLLERRSINDPFLGDAMEGIHLYHKESSIPISLHPIAERRKGKEISLRKVFPYAVAASALIAIGLYTYFMISSPDETGDMNMPSQQFLALTDESEDAESTEYEDSDLVIEQGEENIQEQKSEDSPINPVEDAPLSTQSTQEKKAEIEDVSKIDNTSQNTTLDRQERKIGFSAKPRSTNADHQISDVALRRSEQSQNSLSLPGKNTILCSHPMPEGFLEYFEASSKISQSALDSIAVLARQLQTLMPCGSP